ncbi:MAG: glycosyltransferase involved in cell wall biosynthesis [Bacteroidia bacterium]
MNLKPKKTSSLQGLVNPKLSVVVTTWNNEKFIARCLRSIISQDLSFNYEILVGNDASTDGTADVVRQIESEFPDIIVFYDRPKNVGTSENFIDLVYKAKGEYIAQVDGDDALIDNSKFRVQIDLLDENKDVSICFHHYKKVDADGNELKPSKTPFDKDTITDLDLLLTTTMGPGNTTVFRKNALPPTSPIWLRQCANHKDFALQFLVASKGKIAYIHKVMSAYTIHENNITKIESVEKLHSNAILINNGFLEYHKLLGINKYQEILKGIINHKMLLFSFFFLESGLYFKFLKSIFSSLVFHRHWNKKMLKDAMYVGAPTKFESWKTFFKPLSRKSLD